LSSQYRYVPRDIPVSVQEPGHIPAKFDLLQNYPNPFSNAVNPARGKKIGTVIRYKLSEPAEVYLRFFNLLGEEVRLLHAAKKSARQHEIFWEGRDLQGHTFPPGLYFYRLEATPLSNSARTLTRTQKLILMN